MKVVFLRHGEGIDDVEDRYGGWGDLSLSDKGRKQAEESIEKIKKLNIDKILSSPLKRAFETAEIVGKGLNLKVEKWLYLKERNTYGLMGGERKKEIKKKYPELDFAYENKDWVPGSESYEDLNKRLKIMINKIQEFKERRILAVTHGKFLEAFVKEFLGKEIDKREDCCLLEVEITNEEVEFINADGISFK